MKEICSDHGGEYISNEFKDCFLPSAVIHELMPPDAMESNGIAEHNIQTINMIACKMIIATSEFPWMWAEAVTMATYLKNSFPHKHLLSSTIPSNHFHGK
jgi:hypothetical protein